MPREILVSGQKMKVKENGEDYNSTIGKMVKSPKATSSSDDDLSHRFDSFRTLDMGVPMSISSEKRLSWLRSQIIGRNANFESPFGKRRITYADHTASGRSLQYIETYIINNVLPFYGNTHTCDSYVGCRTTKMIQEASEYVKQRLGGGQDDALLFCGSGTTAAVKRLQEVLGIAIPSKHRDRLLKMMRNAERWIVFVGPYEHHSNLLSWRQSLAEVVEIGLDENGLIDTEALKIQLEKFQCANRPMLGSFSACSNVTGIYTDTRHLARLLHQYGAFACFDFAASGPYVEIDLRSGAIDCYDAVFLSPHKFLGGPGTPGILLMSKALYQLTSLPPSTCGGGTVNYVNGFSEKDTLYMEDIEERENAGTPPIIQKIRTALAFWIKEYIGYQVIEYMENDFIQKALKRLLPNPNIKILGNTSKNRLAILSFLVYSTANSTNELKNNITEGLYMWEESGNKKAKPLHGAFVAKLLNDLFGIQARGGCACAGPYGHSLLNVDETQSQAIRSAVKKGYNGVKPGWTRVSFPYYMTNEEFEFILDALEFTAIYGQRFLPLYNYDWKSGEWSFKKMVLKENPTDKENSSAFDDLAMAARIKELSLNIPKTEEHKNIDTKDNGVIQKYTSYLKIAQNIAVLLPKFPAKRGAPEDIDISLVDFRV